MCVRNGSTYVGQKLFLKLAKICFEGMHAIDPTTDRLLAQQRALLKQNDQVIEELKKLNSFQEGEVKVLKKYLESARADDARRSDILVTAVQALSLGRTDKENYFSGIIINFFCLIFSIPYKIRKESTHTRTL